MTGLVRLSQHIHATPERVFDAWLSPAMLGQFLCPAPGVTTVEIDVNPQLGGRFSLVMLAGEVRIPIHGSYLVMERHSRLDFSWFSHRTNDESRVSLRFEAVQDGTLLHLEHQGFVDEAARQDHEGGWQHIVSGLAALCPAPST